MPHFQFGDSAECPGRGPVLEWRLDPVEWLSGLTLPRLTVGHDRDQSRRDGTRVAQVESTTRAS